MPRALWPCRPAPNAGTSPHKEDKAGKGNWPATAIHDVDLAGVKTGCKGVGGHLELEEGRFPVRPIECAAFDDGSFVDPDLAAIEGQARAQFRRAAGLTGLVDLVIEEQFLAAPDHVGEVGKELDSVAYEASLRRPPGAPRPAGRR